MRKLVYFTIGFAAACFIGAIFYGGWLLLCAVIAFILAGLLTAFGQKWSKTKFIRMVFVGCTAGFLWFGLHDALFVMLPRVADGESLTVTMEATDYSYATGYGSAVEANMKLNEQNYRVKAYLNSEAKAEPGDLITGTFRFRLTTDGGADEPTHHRAEGIFLLAYPTGHTSIQHVEHTPIQHYPAVWRQKLLDQIHEILPGEMGGFAAALLLGDRSGITYEMNTAFKVSGISHVIAVSGLHVSILFGLVYTMLARRRVLSCLIGIPVLFLFAAVVGFTPSITRACIMQALMLIAMVIDREYDGPTALAFAVLVMLVVNPLTVLSISFQLSVGCMTGIFLFSEKIKEYLLSLTKGRIKKEQKLLNRLCNGIASSVSVSLSATVMTTPLVAYHFGCISAFGVVTNLLTLWVISYIFYGLILCLALSLVSLGFAQICGSVISVLIAYVLAVAEGVSQLPMSAMYTSNLYAVVWILCAYVLFAVFLFQRRKQPVLLLLCVVFTFLLAQMFSWFEPMNDDFRVTMLDVGQGQSILLQSDGKTFLVDCGGDDDENAADVTAEMLLSQGIARLDGIIVTHFDKDHVGGIEYLLTRIETDRVFVPEAEDKSGLLKTLSTPENNVESVSEDMRITFGNTEMTIFAPNSQESDNESGICILFRRENCGILITGDRSESGEMMLLQSHVLPDVDILVAGHHGSASSTSEALIAATTPEIAFISVGEDNRYGHPTEIVLQRLMDAGCEIYRTDIHGTVIYRR